MYLLTIGKQTFWKIGKTMKFFICIILRSVPQVFFNDIPC